jgi:hypothetical protein
MPSLAIIAPGTPNSLPRSQNELDPEDTCSPLSLALSVFPQGLPTRTSDDRNTSVYAFVHGDDPTMTEVVAINKLGTTRPVTIRIASPPTFHTVTLYSLIGAGAAVTPATGAAPKVTCSAGICTVLLSMPATSATTMVLR